jgi:ribosomal protein L16 Arg81 hydroxylase
MTNTIKLAIRNAKDSGKTYCVIRNWLTPSFTKEHLDTFNSIEYLPNRSLDLVKDNDELNYFVNQCIEVYPEAKYRTYIIGQSLIDEVKAGPGTPLHRDPFDIVHWQCYGSAIWKIGNNAIGRPGEKNPSGGTKWSASWTQEPETITLNAGDIIWFSRGTWHETENIGKKFSIIFDAGTHKD